MKRRDLLKGLLGLGGAAVTLGGCSKKDENISQNDVDIVPQKTDTFKFSVPLPYRYEVIDKIAQINSKIKKSQVVTFYNSMPLPLSKNFDRFFQIDRGENPNIKTYDHFINVIKYAQSKGFRICYLFNSPKALSEKDYKPLEKEFHYVLDLLKSCGVDEIKVGNTQVATLINEYTDAFKFSISTAAEYHNVSQYKHFINNYPNVDLIDVAIDENHNFTFLKAMRKMFPNVKLEIMVNEPCLKGCPARISHASEVRFAQFNCGELRKRFGSIYTFFKTSAIYPWNLEYYSALGINNFKFLPEGNVALRADFVNISLLENYLNCVEYGCDDFSAQTFFNNMFNVGAPNIPDGLKLSHIIPYLLDIKQFIKNGDKCCINCDVDCHYCASKARALEEFLMYV